MLEHYLYEVGLALCQSHFLVEDPLHDYLDFQVLSCAKILGQALANSRKKRRLAHGTVMFLCEEWTVVNAVEFINFSHSA